MWINFFKVNFRETLLRKLIALLVTVTTTLTSFRSHPVGVRLARKSTDISAPLACVGVRTRKGKREKRIECPESQHTLAHPPILPQHENVVNERKSMDEENGKVSGKWDYMCRRGERDSFDTPTHTAPASNMLIRKRKTPMLDGTRNYFLFVLARW